MLIVQRLCFVCLPDVPIKLFTAFSRNLTKMASWKVEKEKYLSMDIAKKRDIYNKFTGLKDIPTWAEFASTKTSLLDKIKPLQGHTIDASKNGLLKNKVSVFAGDITTLEIEAIVNAANSSLLGGGGVDGAIHRAAGPNLKEECRSLNGCPTGEAKVTGGYKLPAKYIIHTVGPQGEKADMLRNCYENSLKIMSKMKLRSIAFPCISTGIYGYPNLAAAHVAVYAVRKFLESSADDVDRVIFCLFLDQDKQIYEQILQSYFPLE